MTYIKWIFWIVVWVLFLAFLHYTLPQWDTVRIVDTYEKRQDFGNNSIFWASPGSGSGANPTNRDVFFIQAIGGDGEPMIYRNEDTGWGWPPYFKFDTSNLQATATDAKSTADDPEWVAIKHYGWRNEFLTIYPNALRMKPVSGPDVAIIPWTAIIILFVLAMLIWAIWSRWRRFKKRRLDPKFEEWDAAWEERSRRWFGPKT